MSLNEHESSLLCWLVGTLSQAELAWLDSRGGLVDMVLYHYTIILLCY
jgi:hypothetical protein